MEFDLGEQLAKSPPVIVFINDRDVYNYRYRGEVVNELKKRHYTVFSAALDRPLGLLKFFVKSLIQPSKFKIFSSNLRANILVLCLSRSPATILLNGLGRYRRKKLFRWFLILILRLNRNKTILVQNYADFRFFKFYCIDAKWVPGSGGRRLRASGNGIFFVTRKSKIEAVSESVISFCSSNKVSAITIVGVDEWPSKAIEEKFCYHGVEVFFTGYLKQNKIFEFGNVFIQPTGYGEGIPHTLVDALCSDLKVVITKADFIGFGLRKLGFGWVPTAGNWGNIMTSSSAINNICSDNISKRYCNYIIG